MKNKVIFTLRGMTRYSLSVIGPDSVYGDYLAICVFKPQIIDNSEISFQHLDFSEVISVRFTFCSPRPNLERDNSYKVLNKCFIT